MSYAQMMRKPARARIKAYRASGKMFGQTFNTGASWGAGYRPNGKECTETGYIIEWYSDPCPCGRTFEQHITPSPTES